MFIFFHCKVWIFGTGVLQFGTEGFLNKQPTKRHFNSLVVTSGGFLSACVAYLILWTLVQLQHVLWVWVLTSHETFNCRWERWRKCNFCAAFSLFSSGLSTFVNLCLYTQHRNWASNKSQQQNFMLRMYCSFIFIGRISLALVNKFNTQQIIREIQLSLMVEGI